MLLLNKREERMAVRGWWRPFVKIILVIYVLKNTGKLVVNTGKTQEFNLNLNVATPGQTF